jgi:hypothetical protein
MRAIALLTVAPALLAQTLSSSPRKLLNTDRPLTASEIATIFTASRRALAAKTFRLVTAAGGQGTEVLMGPDGRPKMIRRTYGLEGGIVFGVVAGAPGVATEPTQTHWHDEFINIVDYTGRPARRCAGSTAQGEMVIEYEHRGSTNAWTATARNRNAGDVGGPGIAPVFNMLLGAPPVASGEREQIGGRWARAFDSSWTPPGSNAEPPLLRGDPIPNLAGTLAPDDPTQTLWIDTESLLPLRWEASRRGMVTHGFTFTYESIDLRPPPGIDAPACIR